MGCPDVGELGRRRCTMVAVDEEATVPTMIDRDRVDQLLDDGSQLAEVLPAPEYEHFHLPGAVNLPLKDLSRDRAMAQLALDRPVITYCNGFT